MTVEIIVPTLGESVVEATVAKWFKGKGDTVARDEVLVELETDKVNLEVTAETSGTLEEVVAGEGDDVEVGAVLGRIAEGAVAVAPTANGAVNGTAAPSPAPAPTPTPEKTAAPAAEITLSPAVRHMIAETGVDPATINGTGKGGRIVKGDVISAAKAPAVNGSAAAPAPQARAPAPAAEAPQSETRERRVPMSRLRRRVAERLKEAQNTAAMLTTFNEVDMTELMALRAQYKDSFEKRYGVRLGFMSFFVKAAIVALKEQAAVNGEIDGTDIVYKDYYNIGVAVGAPQGLVVPVLKDADRMSFAEVEKSIVDAAVKARDGKLTIADMSGGTFTITNGGVYGSMLSTPILNAPQSAVLGMHNIVKRPVAVGDAVEVRPIMYLALSYDHRIIDGREAVTFLVRLKQCIEDPSRIMLDI